MSMTLSEICKSLSEYIHIEEPQSHQDAVIHEAAFWTPDSIINENCLYILPKEPAASFPAANVIIQKGTILPADAAITSAVIIKDTYPADTLFELIQAILLKRSWPEEVDHKLLTLIRQDADIQHLVDYASLYLGNPFHICNTRYQSIAFTKNVKVENDYHWHIATEVGYVTPENALPFKYEPVNLNTIYNSPLPRLHEATINPITHEVICRRRIIGRLKYQNKLFGHMTVTEYQKDFTAGDIALCSVVAEALVFCLEITQYTFDAGNKLIGLALDCLNHQADEANLDKRARYLLPSLQDGFCLFVTEMENGITSSIEEKVRYFPPYVVPGSFAFCFRGCALLIVNYDSNNQEYVSKSIQGWRSYFPNATIGVSNIFKALSEIRIAYQECLAALRLGAVLHPDDRVLHYQDYFLYHIIDLADIKNHALHSLCAPQALELEQYDSIYGTDYADTLRIYFSNIGDLTKTAKEMHLHRNSLYYRIQRIESILNIDLSDPAIFYSMNLSLHIMELANAENRKTGE